jgi:predicted RNase H-like HicB family nuclease
MPSELRKLASIYRRLPALSDTGCTGFVLVDHERGGSCAGQGLGEAAPSHGRDSGGSLDAMTGQVRLTIRYSDAGDGWVTAQIAEIPAAISEGRTRQEARENVLDALQVVLTPDEELIGGRSDQADSDSLTLTYAA